MSVFEGVIAVAPHGAEIGRPGYLRVIVELSPWHERGEWLGHLERLRVEMVMDWDLADAWIGDGRIGERVIATGELAVIDGVSIAQCTQLERSLRVGDSPSP